MTGIGSQDAIAARIRGIIGGQDRGLIESTARRLGVSEVSLRMSIDEIQPHPTLEVIVAVVRNHGVDPTWLLTGEYDPSMHRKAVDEEAALSHEEVERLIANELLRGPAAGPVTQLRLEA